MGGLRSWRSPGTRARSHCCSFLIARFVPRTPVVWRLVAVAGLGLGNIVLFLLRRPEVYETSIASGQFFLMAAILLLVVGTLRDRARRCR